MRIDLHTHTSCSDGTDTPAHLVAKAHAAGLAVVAVTDHDTTAGWGEARAAGARTGVEVLCGIELSTKNQGQSQHLLAYGPDPTHPALAGLLAAAEQARTGRVPAMLAALADVGVDVGFDAVARFAGTGTVGRPHVADALVAAGVVTDRDEAFDRFLAPGRPGHVPRHAPSIEDAIGAVTAAGGVPVIAHPWGRKTHVTPDRFAELAGAGLAGIEVDHQEHTPEDRSQLRGIAADLGLLVTGSSDHHGLGKRNHELGCNTTDPEVYQQLLARITGR